MAKRHRSAAQKAATRRMLAANRSLHRNPSRKRKVSRRRTVHSNPVSYRRRRTHRNPSRSGGGGGLLNELMSKDGLMMVAAIVGTPTVLELAVSYVMPNSSGMTRTIVKAGLGVGIAWAVYKYLNRKAGVVVGLASVGVAATELINSYMASSSSTIAAPRVVGGYLKGPRGNAMGGYSVPEPGMVRL